MELELIYAGLLSAAPALTAIIGIIFAIASGIKEFKKVDGSLESLKKQNALIIKENQELKKELKKVYKLHSEVVQHIAYKEESNEQNQTM